MITKIDLDDWGVSLGEVIAQRTVERCYKETDYDAAIKKEYANLTDLERFILLYYASEYAQNEGTDLEEFIIKSMTETCESLRHDEGVE